MSATVSVLATGGTISTQAGDGGFVPHLGAEQLLSSVAGSTGVELRHRDVLRISSSAITPLDMWRLSLAVTEEIQTGADAVVVTHGTDTLEETAYALELLLPRSVPVVLTGAMRVPDAPGADGPANVAAAIMVATDARLAPYGPVVVFQDEVHLARYVTKLHSTRVAAFASPAAGPVGMIVESRLVLLHGPPPGTHLLPEVAAPSGRVELLWATSGADGFVIDAIADGIDGLVMAGSGGGHVSPAVAEALIRLVRTGTPVVLASRAPSPRVLRETYGSIGSEVHLLREGLLPAGSLAPLKARLRLHFGLSAGLAPAGLFPPDEA